MFLIISISKLNIIKQLITPGESKFSTDSKTGIGSWKRPSFVEVTKGNVKRDKFEKMENFHLKKFSSWNQKDSLLERLGVDNAPSHNIQARNKTSVIISSEPGVVGEPLIDGTIHDSSHLPPTATVWPLLPWSRRNKFLPGPSLLSSSNPSSLSPLNHPSLLADRFDTYSRFSQV